MSLNGGNIVSYLELDTSKYRAAMDSALSYANAFADRTASVGARVQALGNSMTAIGSRLTLGVTMPIIGGLTAATKAASDFESAFAGVRKTVDASEAQYERLQKSLKEMSTTMPQSASALAGVMEVAGQLGVSTDNLEKFTKTMAMLGDATNLTSEEAASMLAQYANVTGLDLNEIDRLGATVVALGNNCATTERDIVEMAQRISGTASIVGLTDAQVMGMSATLSALGINAEAGGSAVSRTFAKMQQAALSGGAELKTYAATAGMSEEAFLSAFGKDPLSALDAFARGLGAVNENGGDVYAILSDLGLGDVRITDTLLRLSGAGGQLAQNVALAAGAWNENNALTEEAGRRYTTLESKLAMTKNSLTNLAASLGEAILPKIAALADGLTELLNGFNEMDPATKDLILTVGLIAAAIGPVVTVIGGLIALLSGPAGLVIALGAAVAALILWIDSLSKTAEKKDAERLVKQFGDIQLSADELKKVLEAQFPEPKINMTSVNAAVEALTKAADDVETKSKELSTEVYLLTMGVNTEQIDNLPAKATELVASTQALLNQAEYTAKMRVQLLFGEGALVDDTNSAEYKRLIAGYDEYFGGLEAELANKGEDLGAAIKKAIADGALDDKDAEIIQKLRAEINEIATRAAQIDEAAAYDILMYDISKTGKLSAESIKQMMAGIDDLFTSKRENARLNYELLRKQEMAMMNDPLRKKLDENGNVVLDQNGNPVIAGAANQEEKWTRLKFIEAEYQKQLGALDAQEVVKSYEIYGKEVAAGFAGVMQSVENEIASVSQQAHEKALEEGEKGTTAYNLAFDDYMAQMLYQSDAINQAYTDFRVQSEAFLPTIEKDYTRIQEIIGKMGADTPKAILDIAKQYETILSNEQLFQAFEKSGTAFYAEWLEGLEREAQAREAEEQAKRRTEAEQAKAQAKARAEEAAKAAADALKEQEKEQSAAGEAAGQAYADGIVKKEDTAAAAGAVIGEAAGKKAESVGTPKMQGAGANMGAAFVAAVASYEDEAAAAGAALAGAAAGGVIIEARIESPSRVMRGLGNYTGEGYIEGVKDKTKDALKAGAEMSLMTIKGIKAGQQKTLLDSLTDGLRGGVTTLLTYAAGANDAIKNMNTNTGGDAGKDAGKDADKDAGKDGGKKGGGGSGGNQQRELDALIKHNEQMAAAEDAAYQQRVDQMHAQYERMMQIIGAQSVWYNDTALETESAAINERYQALADAETEAYDALTDTKKKAAAQSHEAYLNQLKEQENRELSLLQKNYDAQRQIALDWIADKQQMIRDALAADDEADWLENYEKTLAGYQEQTDELERRMRITKSARQRREIQKQIDALAEQREQTVKDEKRRQEEIAAQKLLDEYDKLAEAVTGGLIGLGDLLQDAALPSVATGSAGIAGIPGLDADALRAALASFAEGLTVQAGASGGNTYQIDLKGAVIRSDDDIVMIVDLLEDRMRSMTRGG